MKLKHKPTVGNRISKEDSVIIDRLEDITKAITNVTDQIPFTEAVIVITGLVHKLLKYRDELLTAEDAGFENEDDLKRFNYFIRLMNKRYNIDIPEVSLDDIIKE
mgnify:FL=1